MSQPLSAPTPELGSLPIELVEMILNSTEADGELILSRSDIRSLRLMNRTLQAASFETFAKQHFTIRKHMLDRRSLDMLLNVAKHPVFSAYVREVAIGPERINAMYIEDDEDLRPDNDPRCSDGLIDSHRDPSTVARFRELVSAQENFDADCDPASEYAMILGQALKTFPNLQTIRLDSYADMEDDEHRPRAWGARPYYEMASELEKTCFQKINLAYTGTEISSIATDDPNFMPPPRILVYRGRDVECMYMNYELVLHALHHIKDDPNWDLEVHYDFTLRRWPQGMKCDELLHLATIDVKSPVWQTFRARIKTSKMAAVFEDLGYLGDDPVYDSWVSEFLNSCDRVRTWAITDSFHRSELLLPGFFDYLRSLTIQRCSILEEDLIAFLENQPLEELVCEDVLLLEQSRRHWLSVCSAMLRCGQLQSLRLSNLYLNCVWFEQQCDLSGSRTLLACNAEEAKSRVERVARIGTIQTWGYDRNVQSGVREFEEQTERLGAIWFVADE